MADVFYGTINTEVSENIIDLSSYLQDVPQIQTQINDSTVPILTQMEDNTHTIQSIMQGVIPPISTIINAPWMGVTSINGMTGDVIVEYIMQDFQTNHYYATGTLINHLGRIYFANHDFNSGDTFDSADWDIPDFEQVHADWEETDTGEKSYIENKPTQISDFSRDLDFLSMIYPVGSIYETETLTTAEQVGDALLGTWAPVGRVEYGNNIVYRYERIA